MTTENKKSLMAKLLKMQQKLKCPKSLTNKFGGFQYRNADQIVEQLKPLEEEFNIVVTTPQEIRQIGDRYYEVTTVRIFDIDTGEEYEVSANAREPESKSGMDASQLSGSSSSYSKKYALGNMFMIDDGVDADSMDNRESPEEAARKKKLAEAKAEIDNCFTVDDLKKLWNKDITLKTDKEFKELVLAKQKELTANN